MLNVVAEILPLFILRWWAKNHCEIWTRPDGSQYVYIRPDVLVDL